MTATEIVDSLYEIDDYLKKTVAAPPDDDPYDQRWAEAIEDAIDIIRGSK